METSSTFGRIIHGQDEDELAEVRDETLRLLIVAICVVSFVAAMVPAPGWNPLPLVLGSWATAGLTYVALRFGPAAATTCLVVGLLSTLTALLWAYPASMVAGYYCLVVLAASSAFNWRAGFGVAVVASVIILSFVRVAPTILPSDTAFPALLLVWSALGLSWLSGRPLRATLRWAWNSYALAQEHVEQARWQQAELGRLAKSLNETCDKLERLNVELQVAREEADAARGMKADFAATVAHELRTPVNLIIGFSEMMASPDHSSYYDEPLPESYRGDVEAIHRNACHISGLVDDILDLSQIDSQRMGLHKEPISLRKVVREAIGNVERLFADAGLEVTVDLPEGLPLVQADPDRIRQVLVNLLYNAVRFTRRGGVTVSAHVADHDVVVEVRDTGSGIPPEELPKLFEAFYQEQSPMRGRRGSGFGLTICKRFVELHGGNIWARSVVGSGTTISFSLPLHDSVASTAAPRRLPVAGQRQLLGVAVIDPLGDTAHLLGRYLDHYRVHRLDRPDQAEHLAADGQLQAVIVSSPGIREAWSDYRRTRPHLQNTPTLYCPLRTRDTIAAELGVSSYLVKPVTREQVRRSLRGLEHKLRQVVVIEDDVEMRALLARTVRSLSRRYTVVEAADGIAGLQAIRELHPDAILLDLLMPEADGYAVLRALAADSALREIPVIVISGKGVREEVVTPLIEIGRPNGLTVGDTVACLRANLDALLARPGGDGPDPAQVVGLERRA